MAHFDILNAIAFLSTSLCKHRSPANLSVHAQECRDRAVSSLTLGSNVAQIDFVPVKLYTDGLSVNKRRTNYKDAVYISLGDLHPDMECNPRSKLLVGFLPRVDDFTSVEGASEVEGLRSDVLRFAQQLALQHLVSPLLADNVLLHTSGRFWTSKLVMIVADHIARCALLCAGQSRCSWCTSNSMKSMAANCASATPTPLFGPGLPKFTPDWKTTSKIPMARAGTTEFVYNPHISTQWDGVLDVTNYVVPDPLHDVQLGCGTNTYPRELHKPDGVVAGKDVLTEVATSDCLGKLASKFATWVRETPTWSSGLQTLPCVKSFSKAAVKVRIRVPC